MKSAIARLSVIIGLGLIAGFLACRRLPHNPPAADATDNITRSSNANPPPSPSFVRDGVFKVFPEEQWIKVPRGLMEHGNAGLDSFLVFSGDRSEDLVMFLGAMVPGAGEPNVQTIANLILELSRDWAQLAAASMQRSGPNEWQVSLPPHRIAPLRRDFAQHLTRLLGPGYAHLVGVLTCKPFATLDTPSMTLTLESSPNRWSLTYKRGEMVMTSLIDEARLGQNSPMRFLLQRARALSSATPADTARKSVPHATPGQKPTPPAPAPKPREGNLDPQSLIGQINTPDALEHSSEIWMPAHVARRFSYSIGSISTTYKMNEEAQEVFGVNDLTRLDIEVAANNLLAEIRELEARKLEIVEHTDDLVHLKIPAGFAPQSRLKEYRTRMEEILGPVRSGLFLEKFLCDLLDVTTAFTDSDRHIRISPDGKKGIKTEIQQNDRTIGTGDSGGVMKQWGDSMPDSLEHLVQAVQDKESK
jgi:hypothetical protein